MSNIRPARADQMQAAKNAVTALREARNFARKADSPKTLAAIQTAIKSAEGAVRHAKRRHVRTNANA